MRDPRARRRTDARPGSIPPTETATPVETPTCLPSGDTWENASDRCSSQCITDDGLDFFCQ